jgi:hypothetical protein
MELPNLLALLLQEVPLYVPPNLINTITQRIQQQFTSPQFLTDPYATEIFRLTDQIPFPTYDINLNRTEVIFPDFLRELVEYEQKGSAYSVENYRFTVNGSPVPVHLSFFILDPVLPYISILYKVIIGSVYKQINVITPYRVPADPSKKTPERINPENRIEFLRENLEVTQFSVTFDWRKTIDTLFNNYVLNYPYLKNSLASQGLLVLSKAFPLYVTAETYPYAFPEKFNYMSPQIWLMVQQRSNRDYGNNRFTLFNLLSHPVASLEEAEVELGMFPLSADALRGSPHGVSGDKGNKEVEGGRKFTSDEYARQAGLLLTPCDRYSYDDLMRMTRIALIKQPDRVLEQYRVPVNPGSYNRNEVITRMNSDINYYNKYLLCQLLVNFSSSLDPRSTEEAINSLFPIYTSNVNQLYYSLVVGKITDATRREMYLDIRKSAPIIAKILSRSKLPPPKVGATTNPTEVSPLRDLRLIIGLKGAYEVLCYDIYQGNPILTRLRVGEGDFLIIVPINFGLTGRNEQKYSNQKISIYPLTKDPEALFVV